MSRIGKLPITLPKGVTLKVIDNLVSIKGPLGELTRQIPPEIFVKVKEEQIFISITICCEVGFYYDFRIQGDHRREDNDSGCMATYYVSW